MTRWAAFVGLTAVLLASLLALARLSQQAVSGDDDQSEPTRDAAGARPHERRLVLPRFESEAAFRRRNGEETAASDSVGPRTAAEMSTGALLANVAITQGAFGLVLAAGAWYFAVPLGALGLAGGPLATGTAGLVLGTVLGVVLWLANEAAGVLADAAGAGYDEELRALLAPDSPGGWVLLLGGVLPTVALVEEFVFRAAAVGAAAAALGLSPWLLAVVSSLAFGVAHGAQGRAGMLVTGGLGFALAAAFVLTESLLVVAVAHYLVNALEIVVHEGLGIVRPGSRLDEQIDV